MVKGNYRPDWHFPGGTIEADQSPQQVASERSAKNLALI